MTFPSDWPTECPPTEAVSCNGIYFHLLNKKPPGPDDLRSFVEKGKTLRFPPSCVCMPFGLSVFTDRDDVKHMRKSMPQLGKWIGTLSLNQQDGKVMLTPGKRPTHNTWWPSIECNRPERITHMEEVA